MDHQTAMRVLDGIAELEEESEPRVDREIVFAAVVVDRRSFDVLHDQVRNAAGGRAAVEQAGDVGMLERGQNLPLLPEALQQRLAAGAAANEFDGDTLFEFGILARRQKDGAHAAVPELADDAIRSDEDVLPPGVGGVDEVPDGLFEKSRRRVVLLEQPLHLGTKIRIAATVEQQPARVAVEVDRGVEQRAHALPECSVERLGGHDAFIAPRSQARAMVHSRLTVAAEISSASAVSSSVSPP